MREVDNPYSPGAGSPPPELAGRQKMLESAKITIERVSAGRSAQSMMLLGLRGVGKTVLLNRIEQISFNLRTQTVMFEIDRTHSFAETISKQFHRLLNKMDTRRRIQDEVKHAFQYLRAFAGSFKVSMGDVDISLSPEQATGDISIDLTDLIVAVGNAAKSRDTAVVILIDEIHLLDENDLTALIIALHKISQRQLPLVMFGAGLPQLAKLAGSSKTYIERLFKFPYIGKLGKEDAITALSKPAETEEVVFEQTALEYVYEETEGYPYYLQLWGYCSWQIAEGKAITLADAKKATVLVWETLDRDFFRIRMEKLTERQLYYAFAMAELNKETCTSMEVAERMSLDVKQAAPIRKEIIEKGIAYTPRRGLIAFTVPHFDKFLRRENVH